VIKSRIIKWVGHLVGNRQKTPWKFWTYVEDKVKTDSQ
jgi:hypothetical protein